jgi:hypothetical protein
MANVIYSIAEDLEKIADNAVKKVIEFIPNELGINLVSVSSVEIDREDDKQIKSIKINFIPEAK